ncbi:MAG: LpxL/LpxP family Kdo(2)-lipid IV(A) lauroyl/palmitoleoyl acyltransferase [Gammaproteobacteria bacterium]|nr:LpxL/LpxP family Kdo(2)-lipid IV(A) lauroyl/palmitoleoyl acyltransferase [Gammaproteobacteria bacterium]
MAVSAAQLAAPRHWPLWVGVGVAWLACRLPVSWQASVGRALGRLAWHAGGRRRRIAEANIDLCFPELSERERAGLVRRTFHASGIGLMETVQAWLGPVDAVADRLECHGLEVLLEAQAEGRGVLLAGAHFLTLDLTGALLASRVPFDVVYRGHRNPVIEWLMVRGRKRHYPAVIERHDLRRAARRLREGHVVWYAADQDYGRRHSVFAPLFGEPAATVVATARLARMGGSPVVFYSHFRDEETRTWSVRFQRVEDFPSGDDETDAARLNRILESEIRRHPEQYLWLHRRFKTRPDGVESPYGAWGRRRKRRRHRRSSR